MQRGTLFIAFTSLLVVGCAHNHPNGTVLLTDPDGLAHICLGKGEVGVGDRLGVYDVKCNQESIGGDRPRNTKTVCNRTKRGEASVVDVLDDHFSTIKPLGQVNIERGQLVERLPN